MSAQTLYCCFLTCLAIAAYGSLLAQVPAYEIQTLSTANGLPNSRISDLLEHKDGYSYLLSPDGISRWDGHSSSHFPTKDPTATWNGNFLKLIAWDERRLAIVLGGANYFLTFDTRTGIFEKHHYPGCQKNHRPHRLVQRPHCLCCCGSGGQRYLENVS